MNKIIIPILILFLNSIVTYAQNWIPKDAKIVYSSKQHDGFLPDGIISLKIKMTKENFNKIIKKIKLTIHTENRKYSEQKDPWLSWSPELDGMLNPVKGENKWNPTWNLSNTYVRQEGHTWEFMKYENGYLYYRWINH